MTGCEINNIVSQLNNYYVYLRDVKRSTNNTLQAYKRDLDKFVNYANVNGILDFADVDSDTIADFKVYLSGLGLSSPSVSRTLSSLRGLYQYLISAGECDNNPAKAIHNDKVEKKELMVLTSKEVELLLSQPDISDIKGLRDKAMLEILYATGIKVSELIAIKMDEVELADSYIICGKGSRRRAVPMGEMAHLAVSRYIEHARNRQLVEKQDTELFLNLNGQALTRQGFWKILKDYKTKANISTDITPHTLRHTFAMHMLENGTEIRDVQTMLGNNSGSSSNMYKKMLDKRIEEIYKKAHPRASKK